MISEWETTYPWWHYAEEAEVAELFLGEELVEDCEPHVEEAEEEPVPRPGCIVCKRRRQEPGWTRPPDGWFLTVEEERERRRRRVLVPDCRISGPDLRWDWPDCCILNWEFCQLLSNLQ